ncbi:MAG: succinylglutamate desuccinylase [Candidatus Hydrogenedentota bacterium]
MIEAEPIIIGNTPVYGGQRQTIELPLPRLYTHNDITMPVRVVNGRPGPVRLFLTAAIHGDELNGVEVVRRVLEQVPPARLTGALVAVPVVNVYGLIQQSRYLPDRRDLNRSFPGSRRGALASQLAHLVMKEIVSKCTHGVDLHTGSLHRTNLPQIRADLEDETVRQCALAFRAPVMLLAASRDGSLRQAASEAGVATIVYEAGEPQRFNEDAIDAGVRGVLRLMTQLQMISDFNNGDVPESLELDRSNWIRASHSGIFHLKAALGDRIKKRAIMGVITDAFGDSSVNVRATHDAVVIGHTNNPLVHRGDAIVHLGEVKRPG